MLAWPTPLATPAAELVFGEPGECVRDGQAWTVRVGDRRVRAGWVLVATGLDRQSLSNVGGGVGDGGGLVGQSWIQPRGPGMPEVGQIEMHWLRGGYVGLAAPSARECVVALAATTGGEGEPVAQALRRKNPQAACWPVIAADAPRRFHATGAAGFPWRPLRQADRNCLLIGDAAGYVEPFSGEGMGQAMGSAACAVQAIRAEGEVAARYVDLLRRHHRPVSRRLAWLGAALRNPVVQAAAEHMPYLPDRLLSGLIARVHLADRKVVSV